MTESRYLFAYGSLIGKSSDETVGTIKIPVGVTGLMRGWYVPVPEDRNTALGAVLQQGAHCNGVLVPASKQYLSGTDARETQHGYSRVSLPWEALIFAEGHLPPKGDLWVYVIDAARAPTQECPIAQSYLDVVLTGCLEISEEFAIEFILTTDGWDNIWVNERIGPRYRRAISVDANRIDAVLQKVIPMQLAKRSSVSTLPG